MSLSLKVDNPSYPKGKPLGINGLGIVHNGETVTVSDETERSFFAANGKTIQEAFEDQEGYEVTGSETFASPPPEPEEPSANSEEGDA